MYNFSYYQINQIIFSKKSQHGRNGSRIRLYLTSLLYIFLLIKNAHPERKSIKKHIPKIQTTNLA